jgi:hypothetical protein
MTPWAHEISTPGSATGFNAILVALDFAANFVIIIHVEEIPNQKNRETKLNKLTSRDHLI